MATEASFVYKYFKKEVLYMKSRGSGNESINKNSVSFDCNSPFS